MKPFFHRAFGKASSFAVLAALRPKLHRRIRRLSRGSYRPLLDARRGPIAHLLSKALTGQRPFHTGNRRRRSKTEEPWRQGARSRWNVRGELGRLRYVLGRSVVAFRCIPVCGTRAPLADHAGRCAECRAGCCRASRVRATVRSSRTETKPAASPRGEASSPSGPTLPITTNGEPSTIARHCLMRAETSFVIKAADGGPYKAFNPSSTLTN